MGRATIQVDGAKFLSVRSQRGLTQEELAFKSGYAKRTIERMERGERAKTQTVEDLADALEVKVDDLKADGPAASTASESILSPNLAMPDKTRDRLKQFRPPVSEFTGRDEELRHLMEKIETAALRLSVLKAWGGSVKRS